MHSITKIQKVASDPITEGKVKKIESTAGNFLSRQSAYNNSFEKIERVLKVLTGKTLAGPPIKFVTFKYARRYFPRQRFLFIKELTESRITRTPYHGVDIYGEEIKLMKNKLDDSERIAMLFPQIAEEDWKIFNEDDQTTISMIQIDAGVPHVAILISPNQTAAQAQNMTENIVKKFGPNQSFYLVVDPHSNRETQKILANYCASHARCIGTMVVCKTPADTHNQVAYKDWGDIMPDNKLLMAADAEDRFGGYNLPTQIVMRTLKFDITCRRVMLHSTNSSYESMETKKPENTHIYVDAVAGLLTEIEQRKYSSKSMTDLLFDQFSIRVGLNFYDFIRAYNFHALNRTGAIEAEHILRNEHIKYIKDRLYLEAFIDAHKPLVPLKTP